ncbi:ABC transporter ATP-binding protein [Anaerosporobacter faecicola]|uniref:ABC transporter ATP-binding protein n=1 Tax=Anaerosporobacter faecicola TaxID=2718714 RepID=UPI0014398414|nr:ABC transporter ATP-binding protein [Anaerosporobacter faecicola]
MVELVADNITKVIKSKKVLDQINLKLEGGNVYGFVGRNGSGKTMLIRMLAGLIHPSEGKVLYNGKQVHKEIAYVPNLGVVIENIGLYPEFTGYQNLMFLAKINNQIGKKEIEEAITRVGLDPFDKRNFGKYSLGMKQRIVLAQAFMEKPDIILLDEPTNALDESGVDLIRSIILEEKKRGALVVVASHNKQDIDLLCDSVYYLRDGKLVDQVGVTE